MCTKALTKRLNSIRSTCAFSLRCLSFQRPFSGSNSAYQAFKSQASAPITMYAQLLTRLPTGVFSAQPSFGIRQWTNIAPGTKNGGISPVPRHAEPDRINVRHGPSSPPTYSGERVACSVPCDGVHASSRRGETMAETELTTAAIEDPLKATTSSMEFCQRGTPPDSQATRFDNISDLSENPLG